MDYFPPFESVATLTHLFFLTCEGKLWRYLIGLPIAAKVGLDLGYSAEALRSHYFYGEAEKITIWNEKGEHLIQELKANSNLAKHLGSKSLSDVRVRGTAQFIPGSLDWEFFTVARNGKVRHKTCD